MKIANEIREGNHTGFLRSANRTQSDALWSEETNRVRTPDGATFVEPMQYARGFTAAFLQKNNILGQMYSYGTALDNRKILRGDWQNKPRLPQLPNKEGFRRFDTLPNVTYANKSSSMPLEYQYKRFRDPYGNSGAPTKGHSNVVLSQLYNANPWGAGGRDFIAVGNEHRKANWSDNKPKSCLKNNANKYAMDKMKLRVKWQH